ncbi:hypothetical protein AB0E27_12345 [Streptomyces sparsogenes]|uniref:hypothetical protein n=1 Tax=Streptomyces sparsogenes TaxID=67365 RepID=UPI0033F99855
MPRLLAGDGRLSFAATLAPDRFGRGCEAEVGRWGLPLVPFEAAAAEPWDLALFGNHGGAHLFTRAAARVFVPHGVGAGKSALGQDFAYGPDFVLRSGKPIYTAMFEASEEGRQRAEDITPRLAGRIRVVGDLETDEFLAVLARRATARAVLGVGPEDFRRDDLAAGGLRRQGAGGSGDQRGRGAGSDLRVPAGRRAHARPDEDPADHRQPRLSGRGEGGAARPGRGAGRPHRLRRGGAAVLAGVALAALLPRRRPAPPRSP